MALSPIAQAAVPEVDMYRKGGFLGASAAQGLGEFVQAYAQAKEKASIYRQEFDLKREELDMMKQKAMDQREVAEFDLKQRRAEFDFQQRMRNEIAPMFQQALERAPGNTPEEKHSWLEQQTGTTQPNTSPAPSQEAGIPGVYGTQPQPGAGEPGQGRIARAVEQNPMERLPAGNLNMDLGGGLRWNLKTGPARSMSMDPKTKFQLMERAYDPNTEPEERDRLMSILDSVKDEEATKGSGGAAPGSLEERRAELARRVRETELTKKVDNLNRSYDLLGKQEEGLNQKMIILNQTRMPNEPVQPEAPKHPGEDPEYAGIIVKGPGGYVYDPRQGMKDWVESEEDEALKKQYDKELSQYKRDVFAYSQDAKKYAQDRKVYVAKRKDYDRENAFYMARMTALQGQRDRLTQELQRAQDSLNAVAAPPLNDQMGLPNPANPKAEATDVSAMSDADLKKALGIP